MLRTCWLPFHWALPLVVFELDCVLLRFSRFLCAKVVNILKFNELALWQEIMHIPRVKNVRNILIFHTFDIFKSIFFTDATISGLSPSSYVKFVHSFTQNLPYGNWTQEGRNGQIRCCGYPKGRIDWE